MKKVCFIVNKLTDFNFESLLEKYLSDVDVSITEVLPENTLEYDLIILWNYRKIIPNVENKKNIIIFHSSDLPEGKGWAPIYNAMINKNKYYTISGILAADKVDEGDIIVKAKFEIKDNYNSAIIRNFDDEISIYLIKEILKKFDNKELKGQKQIGKGSFNTRRYPKDNEIDVNMPFKNLISHFRACEENHPAFFYLNGHKYNIFIVPEEQPSFPDDLNIIFYD